MKKFILLLCLIVASATILKVNAQPYVGRSAEYKDGYTEGLNKIIEFKNQLVQAQPLLGQTLGFFVYKVDFNYFGGIKKGEGTDKWYYIVDFDEATFNANVVNTSEFQNMVAFYEARRQQYAGTIWEDYYEGCRAGYELGSQLFTGDIQ